LPKKAAKGWLVKASRDLRAARALMALKPPLLDMAGFHCQQSIEKCFKFHLASQGQKVRRIHDLRELYDSVVQVGWSLPLKTPMLDKISFCAVIARYPEADDGRLNKRSVTVWYNLTCKIFDYAVNLDR
jgi:HEPN domain-containing protein